MDCIALRHTHTTSLRCHRTCQLLNQPLFLSWWRFRTRRRQGLDQLAVAAIVKTDDTFLSAGSNDLAVRADAHGVQEILVAAERHTAAAVVDVPETHDRVAAAGEDLGRLALEDQARHLLC